MRTTRQAKRTLLSQYLAEARLERITEADFSLLRERLAPSLGSLPPRPGAFLRGGAGAPSWRASGRTPSRSWGARLLALAHEYQAAVAEGDRERARRCRRAVLTGKEHARLAARRAGSSPEASARKEEMASWMLVWLENPGIFPAWLALRRRRLGTPQP